MSQSPFAASGLAKRTPSFSANSARAGLISTSVDLGAGNLAAQKRNQCANYAGADDGDAVGRADAASQTALSAVSMLAASTARCGGTLSGNNDGELGRNIEQVLVRVKREDVAAAQILRAVLDPADRGVAVFDRERKISAHERCAHALMFAFRHAAGKYQRFGAAAERAEERAHARLARPDRRERFLSYFGLTRRDIPECLGKLVGPAGNHFLSLPGLDYWSRFTCYITKLARSAGD